MKKEHFGRGYTWLQIFFVDFLLFYFLTRIIPDFILQSKLADMELRIQSARLLMYKAALLKDADKPFTKVSHYLSLCFLSNSRVSYVYLGLLLVYQ